ncbi:MAG: ATP-binding cassette domain-containing protein [Chloroflexota bacterium]
MAVVEVHDLTKRFGDLVAVDRVSLSIEMGECFGLLGPNGAGKTSLMRMIIAASPPTKGTIRVLGRDLRKDARWVKARLGVVPQHDNLDPDLTVLQNLLVFSRYFGIDKEEARRQSREVLRLFELDDRADSDIRELSGGMKRRLLIARGLINRPQILMLDEPTIGLDPQAKHLVWTKLAALKREGVTQLMSTQNMDEAQRLCDRVVVMHGGRILAEGAPQNLIREMVGNEVGERDDGPASDPQILDLLRDYGIPFDVSADRLQVFASERLDAMPALADLQRTLRRRAATLEDVFFRLTGRSLTE